MCAGDSGCVSVAPGPPGRFFFLIDDASRPCWVIVPLVLVKMGRSRFSAATCVRLLLNWRKTKKPGQTRAPSITSSSSLTIPPKPTLQWAPKVSRPVTLGGSPPRGNDSQLFPECTLLTCPKRTHEYEVNQVIFVPRARMVSVRRSADGFFECPWCHIKIVSRSDTAVSHFKPSSSQAVSNRRPGAPYGLCG